MSRFVTQTLDEKITFLVIAPEDTPLAKEAIAVLEENQVAVKKQVPSLKKLSTTNHDEIYKYILIYQSNNGGKPSVNDEILTWLKPFQQQLLVLGTVTTPYQGKVPLFSPWFEQTQHQAAGWQQVIKALPEATYCLGQDIFSEHQPPIWSTTITQKVKSGEILISSKAVFPQEMSYFATTISQVLLSPFRGERWLYQGPQISLRQLAEKTQHHYQTLFETKLEEKTVTTNGKKVAIDDYLPGEWRIKKSSKRFVDDLAILIAEHLPQVSIASSKPQIEKTLPTPKRVVANEDKPLKPKKVLEPQEVKNNKLEQNTQKVVLEEENTDSQSQEEEQIESALQKLFAQQQVQHKVKRVTKVAKETKKATVKNKRKKSLFYLGLGFVGMSLGILVLFASFLVSVSLLERQLLVVSQKLQETHTKTFNEESQQLAFLTSVVEAQMESYQVVLSENLFTHPDSLVEVSKNVIGLGEAVNVTRNLTQQAVRQAFGSETGDVFNTLQAASNKANDVYQQLSLLQAAIDRLDQEKLSETEVQKLEDFTQTIQEERKSLAIVQQLQPLMTQILGEEQKRTYAILLQDNQELRPTGGFLNSVAIITVDQGLVIDTQVYSVNDLEKNFGGEIEPPEEIKTLLQEEKLFFHDANWNPDFTVSAAQIAWFIEKTTGSKVNGVIALDLYGIEALIKATGPLELPEYNEVLTDRNIHERSEFHSEITLDDGAGEASYLPVVLQKLINQVLVMPQDNVGAFLAGVNQSLKQNHIQVYFADNAENTSFNTLGWTGSILSPQCPVQLAQDACQVDAFYQVEANIGVNKANHYVKRTINHSITLDEIQAVHQRTISFKNTAPTNAWPRGEYSTYIRFYLPEKATLTDIRIDNKLVNKEQLIVKNEDSRVVVGVVVRVPIQTEQEVAINFAKPLVEAEFYSYAFFDQKQPGTADDTQVVTITTTDGRIPSIIAPQASVNQNVITFHHDRNQHLFVGVSFE